MDGSVAFESKETQSEPLSEHAAKPFDWVDYHCPCPDCGAEVTDFRTRDLCHVFDTVDYRIANHF